MQRKAKGKVLPPCRGLSRTEASALLLVRPEWQTLDELQAQGTMARYELRGFLGVLGVLSLIDLEGQRYRLRPGGRTEAAVSSAGDMLRAETANNMQMSGNLEGASS